MATIDDKPEAGSAPAENGATPHASRTRGLGFSARLMLAVWGLFALLVAFGVSGSSIPMLAELWMPHYHYDGYLLQAMAGPPPADPRAAPPARRELVMAESRRVRSDEWLTATPIALAQLSHHPRFPVVNTNIGLGENVLMNPYSPVWHITLLARPVTWGFFFLGEKRGLAWFWWFGVFACFTALYFLLELILQSRTRLAAFGAFWFCGSAYVICWSLWPAYTVVFPIVLILTAYWLLRSHRPLVQIASGLGLGLGLSGFFMQMYPPWTVPLGYLALAILAGLMWRDRAQLKLRPMSKTRIAGGVLALAVAAILVGAFVYSCAPAISALAASVYPGQRVTTGGGYGGTLFRGMYNLITNYSPDAALLFGNESEASCFFYFFPAVIFAALLAPRRVLKLLGPVGVALIAYLVLLLDYARFGLPRFVANLTMMKYVTTGRTDLAFGLASILLCTIAVARFGTETTGGPTHDPVRNNRRTLASTTRLMPRVAAIGFGACLLAFGLALSARTGGFPPMNAIAVVSLLGGYASYCMLGGKGRTFCAIVAIAVIATSAFFNPLSTDPDFFRNSELAGRISELDAKGGANPLWMCYGNRYTGVLVNILGGRTFPTVQRVPQNELWRMFDPTGANQLTYNRFAHVFLVYDGHSGPAAFTNPQTDMLFVDVSPADPAVRKLGVKYILATGDSQKTIGNLGLAVVVRSSQSDFSIFEAP